MIEGDFMGFSDLMVIFHSAVALNRSSWDVFSIPKSSNSFPEGCIEIARNSRCTMLLDLAKQIWKIHENASLKV